MTEEKKPRANRSYKSELAEQKVHTKFWKYGAIFWMAVTAVLIVLLVIEKYY